MRGKNAMLNEVKNNNKGFVAIFTAMVVSMLVSMMAISFMTLMTKNDRQTLDRVLSEQASYAAESGANDALDLIKNGGAPSGSNDSCDINTNDPTKYQSNGQVGGNSDIKYTCQVINSESKEIVFDGTSGNTVVFPLATVLGTPITSMTFEWSGDQSTYGGAGPATGLLPNSDPASWARPPILQVSIFTGGLGVTSSGPLHSTDARNKSYFLRPNSKGGVVATSNPADGFIAETGCGAAPAWSKCIRTLSSLAPSITTGADQSFVAITPIYGNAKNVKITAAGGGGPVTFKDAQYTIDITAQAADVYRRFQYRAPKVPSAENFGNVALMSSGSPICKLVQSNGSAKRDDFCSGALPPSGNNYDNDADGVSGNNVNGQGYPLPTSNTAIWQKNIFNKTNPAWLPNITKCDWQVKYVGTVPPPGNISPTTVYTKSYTDPAKCIAYTSANGNVEKLSLYNWANTRGYVGDGKCHNFSFTLITSFNNAPVATKTGSFKLPYPNYGFVSPGSDVCNIDPNHNLFNNYP